MAGPLFLFFDLAFWENDMNNTAYRTSDLHLATFLKISGLRLIDVLPSGRRAIFVFEDGADRQKLVLRFINQQGQVEPVRFVEAWKSLKALAGGY